MSPHPGPLPRGAKDIECGLRPSFELEDVLHRVEPRLGLGDEPRRAERAADEGVAALGAMCELQALAQAAEAYRVLADHVARADRVDADLLLRALARQAVAAVHAHLGQVSA